MKAAIWREPATGDVILSVEVDKKKNDLRPLNLGKDVFQEISSKGIGFGLELVKIEKINKDRKSMYEIFSYIDALCESIMKSETKGIDVINKLQNISDKIMEIRG